MLQNKSIGFIGGGAIAEALIKGMLNAKLISSERIHVYEINKTRREELKGKYGVSLESELSSLTQKVEVLFLTVKPQVIDGVLEKLRPILCKDIVVISVAAGISLSFLQEKLGAVPIVRVMPNTPVAVGEGMSVISLGNYAREVDGQLALSIFSAVGKALIMGESFMDAVTGLSGSGPGYVFLLIDALSDAGVKAGLTRSNSILMAAQTMLGSAKMVLETGEHPAKLRDMVTSPGGTTIAGIHVLEQNRVRGSLIDAVEAAVLRSQEMGKKTNG